jgi:hypothetical protein
VPFLPLGCSLRPPAPPAAPDGARSRAINRDARAPAAIIYINNRRTRSVRRRKKRRMNDEAGGGTRTEGSRWQLRDRGERQTTHRARDWVVAVARASSVGCYKARFAVCDVIAARTNQAEFRQRNADSLLRLSDVSIITRDCKPEERPRRSREKSPSRRHRRRRRCTPHLHPHGYHHCHGRQTGKARNVWAFVDASMDVQVEEAATRLPVERIFSVYSRAIDAPYHMTQRQDLGALVPSVKNKRCAHLDRCEEVGPLAPRPLYSCRCRGVG